MGDDIFTVGRRVDAYVKEHIHDATGRDVPVWCQGDNSWYVHVSAISGRYRLGVRGEKIEVADYTASEPGPKKPEGPKLF